MKKIFLFIALIAVTFSSYAQKTTHHTVEDTIHFKINNGLIVVGATINGKNGYFVIDCGSSASYLNEALSRQLDFDSQTASGQIAGFGGDASVYQVSSFIDIDFGDFSAKNAIRRSCDLSAFTKVFKFQILGLIGNDFLKFYHAKIDFDKQIIIVNL